MAKISASLTRILSLYRKAGLQSRFQARTPEELAYIERALKSMSPTPPFGGKAMDYLESKGWLGGTIDGFVGLLVASNRKLGWFVAVEGLGKNGYHWASPDQAEAVAMAKKLIRLQPITQPMLKQLGFEPMHKLVLSDTARKALTWVANKKEGPFELGLGFTRTSLDALERLGLITRQDPEARRLMVLHRSGPNALKSSHDYDWFAVTITDRGRQVLEASGVPIN